MAIFKTNVRLDVRNDVSINTIGGFSLDQATNGRAVISGQTVEFGRIEFIFLGTGLAQGSGLDPDGRVTSLAVEGDQGTIYSYAEIDVRLVDLVGVDDLSALLTEDDRMTGSLDDDLMAGLAGDDTIHGRSGDDDIEGGFGADHLIGAIGSDTLDGGRGGDVLNGGTQRDFLYGGGGRDELLGAGGRDQLYGGAGGDTLDGGGAGDLLSGGGGNDALGGGGAADTLDGGRGKDTLAGERGADELTGGGGRDVFTFADGGGTDAILDFETGRDRIDLADVSSVTGFPDLDRNHLSQVGADAVISYAGGGSIRIVGVDEGDLSAGDFIF